MYENISSLCTEPIFKSILESSKRKYCKHLLYHLSWFLLVDVFVSLLFFFNLFVYLSGRPEALYAAINKKPTSAAYTVGEGEFLAICKLNGSQISY